MTALKLLIASDLHYCRGLAEEIAAVAHRLPPDEYDHMRAGRLFWHNEMLVDDTGHMLTALAALAAHEAPDAAIFLGDLVSTNWAANVADVGRALREFPCPVEMVTGNHDIYLADAACRLQDAVTPSTFETGLRVRWWGDLGVIFLDLFVHYADGAWHKWLDPAAEVAGVDYRPQDVAAALDLLAAHPDRRFLLFGHFPMTAPDPRVLQPDRRVGRTWHGGARLCQRLREPGNLLGIICGHQHFAHLQRFEHGFHWTVPALVEYPCAAALLEVECGDAVTVRGRLITPDDALASRSLRPTGQRWTQGEARDRAFALRF